MREKASKTGSEVVAALLRERREAAGMSRRDLAESTGLSYPHISQLETGYRLPSHRAIQLLARALDMDPGDLFAAIPEDLSRTMSAPPVDRRTGSESAQEPAARSAAHARWIANPAHMKGKPQQPFAAELQAQAGHDEATRRAIEALESLPAEERLEALQEVQAAVIEGIVREQSRRRPRAR